MLAIASIAKGFLPEFVSIFLMIPHPDLYSFCLCVSLLMFLSLLSTSLSLSVSPPVQSVSTEFGNKIFLQTKQQIHPHFRILEHLS